MSYKMPTSNNIKLNCDNQWVRTPSLDTNIKLAGEEAKDRLYEPKHKKKLVRVLTVIAYIFFVSLAAIMLSLYYVFLWNGTQKENNYKVTIIRQGPQVQLVSKCTDLRLEKIQVQAETLPSRENQTSSPLTIMSTEESSTWPDYDYSPKLVGYSKSTFIKKLIRMQNAL